MNALLRFCTIAVRPFVTRALRGTRRRTLTLCAGIMALLILIAGSWVGQSRGRMAHDMRVSLDLERSRSSRARTEFLYFVDTPRQFERAEYAQQIRRTTPDPDRFDPARYRAVEAWEFADAASDPHNVAPPHLRELQARARQLRNERLDLAPSQSHRAPAFAWDNGHHVQRLTTMLDAELNPTVVLYESPLSYRETLGIIGTLAGGLLLLLLAIAAPLWTGVMLAQELHENTLQPLTGTALSARQLVLGLIAGACAPIAILAAPLVVLLLSSAAIAGRLLPAVGTVATGLGVAALLIGLCMLAARLYGGRRAPGIIGISLLAILGMLAAFGVGIGLNLNRSSVGLTALMPTSVPIHLLAESFFPAADLSAANAIRLDFRVALVFVAAGLLAALCLRGLERLVGGTAQAGALNRKEAGLAAVTIVALTSAAIPPDGFDTMPWFFTTTALAFIPLQVILAARAPAGDVPPKWRWVPVRALVLEHLAWIGLALLVAIVAAKPSHAPLRAGMIIGAGHLFWVLLVVPLITLRATGHTSIGAKLWLALSVLMTMISFGTAGLWLIEGGSAEAVLPLGAASPALGAIQLVLLVWIPVSLWQGLQPDMSAPPRPEST